MKIYISGKISGLPFNQVIDKFNNASKFLNEKGFIPVNPIEISPFDKLKKWSDYMLDDIASLFECDAIYMLNDWGQSKGARIEYQIAKELGLQIFFENDLNIGGN